jgi:hypothetical protein
MRTRKLTPARPAEKPQAEDDPFIADLTAELDRRRAKDPRLALTLHGEIEDYVDALRRGEIEDDDGAKLDRLIWALHIECMEKGAAAVASALGLNPAKPVKRARAKAQTRKRAA